MADLRFIPVAGQLDDLLVVVLVLRGVLRAGGPDLSREHWPGPPASLKALLALAYGRGAATAWTIPRARPRRCCCAGAGAGVRDALLERHRTVVVTVAALVSGSVALAGFGLDLLIEIGASPVVMWQLNDAAAVRERRALRLIGIAFVALALYVAVQAAYVYYGLREGREALRHSD